jgi:hypothetical protein
MIYFFKRLLGKLFKGKSYWQNKAQDYAGTIELIYIELGAMTAEREALLVDFYSRAVIDEEILLAKYHQAFEAEERIERLLKKEGIDIDNFHY